MAQGIEMRPPSIDDKKYIVLMRMGDAEGRVEFICDIKNYLQSKIDSINPVGVAKRMDIWKLQQQIRFWNKEMDSLCKK